MDYILNGKTLCFDYNKFPGGPYGKKTPCSIYLVKSKDGKKVIQTRVTSGFESEIKIFNIWQLESVYNYLLYNEYFRRLYYLDEEQDNFKVLIKEAVRQK